MPTTSTTDEPSVVEDDATPPPRRSRVNLLALVLAVGVALMYAGIKMAGLIPGVVQVAIVIVLFMLLPSAKLFSRRVLLNGALVFGWYAALWYIPNIFGTLGRVGLVTAIALGGLAYIVVRALTEPQASLNVLVPRFRLADIYMVLSGACATWFAWTILMSGTAVRAMSRLMGGWDQAGHFSMIYLQRLNGELPAAESGFDDTLLFYAPYSQYLHSLINGWAEMRSGPKSLPAPTELVMYAQGYSLIYIGLVVLVIAGILQIRSLRHRPLVTFTVVAFTTSIMILGQGGSGFQRGHLNVVYGAGVLALLLLVVVPQPRILRPIVFATSAGLIVAATGAWPLLGPIGVVIGVVALLSSDKLMAQWRQYRVSTILVSIALLASMGMIALTIMGYQVAKTLTLPGDAVDAPLASTALYLGVSVLCLAWPASRLRKTSLRTERSRSATHAWSAAGCVAILVLLGGWQLMVDGQLSYYFWKLGLGIQLLAVAFIAIGAARVATNYRLRLKGVQRVWAALATVLITGFSATTFGYVTSELKNTFGYVSAAANLRYLFADWHGYNIASARVLNAYEVAKDYPKGKVTYLAVMPLDGYSVLDDHWMHALLGDWSVRVDEAAVESLNVGAPEWTYSEPPNYSKIADVVEKILVKGGEGHYVLVARERIDGILEHLSDDLKDRVISW